MKIKKNLKKGAGIEIAILAMVVVFALSALLVSITLISRTNANNALDDLKSDSVIKKVSSGLGTDSTKIDVSITKDGKIITEQESNT